MCAGITVYSSFVNFGLKPHQKLGVMGLGGLGHMTVKIGKVMGNNVTVISRNTTKKKASLDLNADGYIDMNNVEEMTDSQKKFDFIIDTIGAPHDIGSFLRLLKINGKLILLGIPSKPLPVSA